MIKELYVIAGDASKSAPDEVIKEVGYLVVTGWSNGLAIGNRPLYEKWKERFKEIFGREFSTPKNQENVDILGVNPALSYNLQIEYRKDILRLCDKLPNKTILFATEIIPVYLNLNSDRTVSEIAFYRLQFVHGCWVEADFNDNLDYWVEINPSMPTFNLIM